ncbi:bifunctional helix-turn-helix transcriptional regulator/GNAT family N-acetyltransferase [Leptospira haakeii]|uniref:MarR family transcriptional regulator n=1 Tax=Leptospira haakeii TaxID=2023198 RepID=A0ABX4PJ66_9LEPT|nr:bifunctional helix-turn-helix transcriptional regulator/GNAT family N-acetyltransferase [Leptospira haakeii]PKA15670.1 MarR family transcriptional regulator [Leptospira haakeii]PKA21756.1 MarR family transcriptional regulator [Leptospira haakeii]
MKDHVDSIREFNRYYTNALGLLNNHFLNSEYSLTEARLLYEIRHSKDITAGQLVRLLNLDKGYLSRTIQQFEKKGILKRTPSRNDSRILHLELTKKGKDVLSKLISASNSQISGLLKDCSDPDKNELVSSMNLIIRVLSKELSPVIYREARIGDLGYMIHRQAVLYRDEYKFNDSFEEYLIQGMLEYLKNKTEFDRVWIAESNGNIAGAISIIHSEKNLSQIRWFYTEPKFRNLGIGKNLLTLAVDYAKSKNVSIFLWTLNNLDAARNLYKRFGFVLSESKQNQVWKKNLTEERWDLGRKLG